MTVILVAFLVMGSVAALGFALALEHRLRLLRMQEVRVVAFTSELGHARVARERLESMRDDLVDSLDASSRAARATHQAIADIPFSILERIPATRDGARQVRRIHDLASDGVYAGIGQLAAWQRRRRRKPESEC